MPRSARPAQVGIARGRLSLIGLASSSRSRSQCGSSSGPSTAISATTSTVTATIAQVSDSLDTGDIVTYRDVIVGEVRSFTANGHGGAELQLRLHASSARSVPCQRHGDRGAQPACSATPRSTCVPPGQRSRHVAAQRRARRCRLLARRRSACKPRSADAYDLITAVHPARLDAALTSLATRCRARGRRWASWWTRRRNTCGRSPRPSRAGRGHLPLRHGDHRTRPRQPGPARRAGATCSPRRKPSPRSGRRWSNCWRSRPARSPAPANLLQPHRRRFRHRRHQRAAAAAGIGRRPERAAGLDPRLSSRWPTR